LFYAEVEWLGGDKVQFVKGHGVAYDKLNQNAYYGYPLERWAAETSNWLGSNYLHPQIAYSTERKLVYLPILYINMPFNGHSHEDQVVTNSDDRIIFNYGATHAMVNAVDPNTVPWYLPSFSTYKNPPQVCTYWKHYGYGRVIIFGLYSDQSGLLSDPKYLKFIDYVVGTYGHV
jgi:hypothetical protein